MLSAQSASRFSVLIVLLFSSSLLLAESEVVDEDFCVQAQQWIADTELSAENVLHQDYQTFVESKAIAVPLQTQQFYSHRLPDADGIPSVVSCKMRTRGSITASHSPQKVLSDWGNSAASCHQVTGKILSLALAAVSSEERLLNGKQIVIDEERLTFMGPMWLDPWPFQAAYTDEFGKLHLRSRALYVPWSKLIPAPAAFKGVYYCHLVSPEYLQALLRGEVQAPVAVSPE